MDKTLRIKVEKLLLCTLCSRELDEPVTIATCSDSFCDSCIKRYALVTKDLRTSRCRLATATVGFASSNNGLAATANNAINLTLTCPTCGIGFDQNSLIRGISRANSVVRRLEKEDLKFNKRPFSPASSGISSSSSSNNGSGSSGSQQFFSAVKAEEINDQFSCLIQCKQNLISKALQLSMIEEAKRKHWDELKRRATELKDRLLNQVNEAHNVLISGIEKCKSIFEESVRSEKAYYKFLGKNVEQLTLGLKRFLNDSCVEQTELNYKSFNRRVCNIKSESADANVPEALLKKYKITTSRQQFSVKNFGQLEENPSERFDPTVDPNFHKLPDFLLNTPIENGMRKWLHRLQNTDSSSSNPMGICFWPDGKSMVVAERSKGRILYFYTNPDKNRLSSNQIFQEVKDFSPMSLVRMDRGCNSSGTTSRSTATYQPNLAMIDKNSSRICIFRMTDKKFKYLPATFELPSGLAYYEHGEKDGRFILTDTFSNSLEMLTADGKSIWKKGSKKNSEFTSPSHVAVNHEKKLIIVSDADRLHYVDLEGNIVQTVSAPLGGKKAWKLKGICLMKNGDILVAESSENRVIKLSGRDGQYMGDVLTSNEVRGVSYMDLFDDRDLCLTQEDGHVSLFELF